MTLLPLRFLVSSTLAERTVRFIIATLCKTIRKGFDSAVFVYTMENLEELQLKVEELLYKNDVDVLLQAAEKLKYEKIEELKEKSRGQVINLVRRWLQEIVEGIESPTAKNQLLNDVFFNAWWLS